MGAGWVLLYFSAASVVLALLCFPDWRVGLSARLAHWWQGSLAQGRRSRDKLAEGSSKAVKRAAQEATDLSGWWHARRRWAFMGLAGLTIPVVLVVGWSRWAGPSLDGFDDRIEPSNERVTRLLQGEQLAPPAALPPNVFATIEVEAVRPMLSDADRRWERMDPEFVQRLLHVFKIMKAQYGYDMALLEGWRSPERQAMLAAKGSSVTMAGPWQSYHQYGLASDCAFYRDGKLVISEKDPWAMRGYQLYGQEAERLGLVWGGRWQMADLGHIEWRKPGGGQAPLHAVN